MSDDHVEDHEFREMLRNVHDYFMKPRGMNLPSRAEELDDVLDAVRAGKFVVRAVLWFLGVIAAIGAAIAVARGWITKWL
jgi:hypothetical protein